MLFDNRPVTNVIHTTVTVSDLVAKQADAFDFWTWSKQSLGLPGLYLDERATSRELSKLERSSCRRKKPRLLFKSADGS